MGGLLHAFSMFRSIGLLSMFFCFPCCPFFHVVFTFLHSGLNLLAGAVIQERYSGLEQSKCDPLCIKPDIFRTNNAKLEPIRRA